MDLFCDSQAKQLLLVCGVSVPLTKICGSQVCNHWELVFVVDALVTMGNVLRPAKGILGVVKHSEPTIGGSLATANRFSKNSAHIKAAAYQKRGSIRTLVDKTVEVPFNYWGTDCPQKRRFRGLVMFTPWVNGEATKSLSKCPPLAEAPALGQD